MNRATAGRCEALGDSSARFDWIHSWGGRQSLFFWFRLIVEMRVKEHPGTKCLPARQSFRFLRQLRCVAMRAL